MTTNQSKRTVLVLPTYNEIENLEAFIAAVHVAAPAMHVLIVDDNSPDGTGELADRLAQKSGLVEVIHRHGERGLGSAYRAGFARAIDQSFSVIMTMDADFSHDPALIPKFIDQIDRGADVVIGSRYVRGGAIKGWPVYRTILSRWGNAYTRAILHLKPRDCTSGYRAYSANALKTINPADEHGEGYVSLTAFIRRAQQCHLKIVEVPITFSNRVQGTSKMSWRIVLESMWLVTLLGVRDVTTRIRRRA